MPLFSSLQGPKSEDDVADGAEAEVDEADELSGYEPESDVNTMTVLWRFTCSFFISSVAWRQWVTQLSRSVE